MALGAKIKKSTASCRGGHLGNRRWPRMAIAEPPWMGSWRVAKVPLPTADLTNKQSGRFTLPLTVFHRRFIGPALESAVKGTGLGKARQIDNLFDRFIGARQQTPR